MSGTKCAKSYSFHGKTYIKIGPYGFEDVAVNVLKDGKVILPRNVADGVRFPRHFDSISEAYQVLNDEWIDKNNQQQGV